MKKLFIDFISLVFFLIVFFLISITPIGLKLYYILKKSIAFRDLVGSSLSIIAIISLILFIIITFKWFFKPCCYVIYRKIGIVKLKNFRLKMKILDKMIIKNIPHMKLLNMRTNKTRVIKVLEDDFNYFLVGDLIVLDIEKEFLNKTILSEFNQLTLYDDYIKQKS